MLREPLGCKSAEVMAMSIPAVIVDETGGEHQLRVMHPVLCMESRAHNTAHLPGYDQPLGLMQLAPR